MDLVQGLLKEEKQKKRELKKKKSSKSMGSSSSHGTRSELGMSGHSRGSVTVGSASSGSYDELHKDPLHCKNIMKLQKSWESLKKKMNASDIGETIVTSMVEVDPSSRQAMKIESLPSEKGQEVGATIVESIDCIIFVLGPDFDQDDVADSVKQLTQAGVSIDVLTKALPRAVMECVGNISDKEKSLWNNTMTAAMAQVGQEN